MSILIFSSDQSFGDFLLQSLRESDLDAHQAISFSDAELKLYKSEPDIAIFVDLAASELRKIGRAVGEGCSVLVIGNTSHRNIIKAHWRFLSMQSSVTAVLVEITDFFLNASDVVFSLGQEPSSHSLEEHFSTAASTTPNQSNILGRTLGKKKIATYGLDRSEIEQLRSFEIVGETETPFCDSILARPDRSQAFLDFLALTQSVLPTALVSLGPSKFFQLLACSVVNLDANAPLSEIIEAIRATNRENGPCYPVELQEKNRLELERLGCRIGAPFDFLPFDPKNKNMVEQVRMEHIPGTGPQNDMDLYSDHSDFEKRRSLWFVAARTRSLQNRRVQHLPDLMRGLDRLQAPYLLSISTERTDSRQFISNMLRESVPLMVDSKTALLCLCEANDLKHIEVELDSLQRWTGRDTKGLGWFPRIQTRAFKIGENMADILASIDDMEANQTSFEIIDDIHERIQQ